MKKHLLLPLVAIALSMGAVTACGPQLSPEEQASASASKAVAELQSVEIANKEALAAEWRVGDSARSLDIRGVPVINATELMARGLLTIASSNVEAVTVSGLGIFPVGIGTATITVTVGDKTDSVDVEVKKAIVEADYEKKTLAEILAEEVVDTGNGKNFASEKAYMTKVKVAVLGKKADGSEPNDKYGSLYVTDEAGENQVQVYGASASAKGLVFNKQGGFFKFSNPQDWLTNLGTKDIKVGDVLDVVAIRCDYTTTKEISIVVRAVNGVLISNRKVTSEEIETFEFTNNEKKFLYTVTGKITGWKSGSTDGTKYGNLYVTTEGASKAIYVYGASAATDWEKTKDDGTKTAMKTIELQSSGALRYNNPQDWLTNDVTKDLKIGDTITVTGFRCDYNGTVELNGIVTIPQA